MRKKVSSEDGAEEAAEEEWEVQHRKNRMKLSCEMYVKIKI